MVFKGDCMRVLVTGASGLIGSNLFQKLKDDGYDIVMTPEHSDNGKKWWGRYNYLGRINNGK